MARLRAHSRPPGFEVVNRNAGVDNTSPMPEPLATISLVEDGQ